MMKLLALAALAAVALASSSPYDFEWESRNLPERELLKTEFTSDGQYEYVYNGQLMTGVPGASEQHSGMRVQALVKLQFKTESEVKMQLKHVRFGYLNERVSNPRRVLGFDAFEPAPIDEKLERTLRLPVQFEYRNGMISGLHFAGAEQPWSANMKRSVLNMLQVNLNKERLINEHTETDKSSKIENNDFFKTFERSIEGECETAYTSESTPSLLSEERNVLNVTKTINFENCMQRPDIKYNFRTTVMCPSCEKRYQSAERVLRSSSVLKMNMTVSEDRRNFLIESARVESQYSFVPFTEEGNIVQTYVNQTLVLVRSKDIEREIESLSGAIKSDSGLVFTNDWDVTKELFFMEGETKFQDATPYSPLENKIEFVKTILEKLTTYMRESVEEEAPRQFARLVKVLRMLKYEELVSVHKKFHGRNSVFPNEKREKVSDILLDAVAVCGTNDCVKHIVKEIESGKIPAGKAAMCIRKMQQIRVVSPKIIERVWKLTNGVDCDGSKMVCQAAYLTTGSLLRAMCSPSEDKLALSIKNDKDMPMCDRAMKMEWLEKLFERFEKCDNELCRVTVLKSIGNAGLPESLKKLEKIIRERRSEFSANIRVEAILATRVLCRIIPRKVETVLMPVYMNKLEKPFVRMAALNKLVECQPEKFIVDQLTRSLFSETNRQVLTFSWTTFNSLANSTNPCEKRLADDIKLSLRHSRFVPTSKWIRQSKMLRLQAHCDKMNRGFAVDFNQIFGNFSAVPQDIAVSLHAQMGNLWGRYIATIGATQNKMESYIRRAVRRLTHNLQTPLGELLSGRVERVNPKFNGRKHLRNLYESLDVLSLEQLDSEAEAFASIYLRFADQDYAFLPFAKDIIPEHIKQLIQREEFNAEKIVKMLGKYIKDAALRFNVHTGSFMHETSRKIPTTFGVPLQLSAKSPFVAQASGIIKVNVDEEKPLERFTISVHGLKPSFVLNSVDKIEAWTPIVNTGLKIVGSAKIYLPIEGKLIVDASKAEPTVKMVVMPQKTIRTETDIVRLTTRPVTTVLVWPRFLSEWQEPIERTIIGEEWNRVQTFDKTIGEETTGVAMNLRYHFHHTPERRVPTTPYCPLAGPNKIAVTLTPTESIPKEIEMTLSTKLFNELESGVVKPEFERFFSEEGDEYITSSSSSESTESRSTQYDSQSEEMQKRLRERLTEFEGEQPIQHKIKLNIVTKGAPVKREWKSELIRQCSRLGKSCITKLTCKAEPSNWALEGKLETLSPATPFTVSQFTADKKFVGRLTSKWGIDMENKLDMKLVGEQTEQMRRVIRSSNYFRTFNKESLRSAHESLYSPVAQYEKTLKWGVLDQYKLDIDYNMARSTKNITEQMFRLAKHYYFWQTQVDVQLPEELKKNDQITARINVDPVNMRYLNATIITPREKVIMSDMPINSLMKPMNVRRISTPSSSFYDMLATFMVEGESQPLCEIRTDRVNTFDKLSYRAPVTKCWSVIAKDCFNKESSSYAVLIKRESGEKKTLKIVTGDMKLIVRPKTGYLECELNGEKKPCEEVKHQLVHAQHTLIRVTPFTKEYIKIELPEAGVKVYFDGLAANVKLSPWLIGSVCGLCGHYDGEMAYQTCELRTARNECVNVNRPEELKRLVRSYLVNDQYERDECSAESELIENESNYEYMPLSWDEPRYEHFSENDEIVRRNGRRFTVRPIKQHKIIEHSHEVCFSKLPVKSCPKHSYGVERENESEDITYTCMPRHQRKAERILRKVHEGRIVRELAELPASFTKPVYVPKTCRNGDL